MAPGLSGVASRFVGMNGSISPVVSAQHDGATEFVGRASADTPAVTSAETSSWRVFCEDWDHSYGAPATFQTDTSEDVEAVETTPVAASQTPSRTVPLCFVDGRRRVELGLWAFENSTNQRVAGIAGCYSVGAVTVRQRLAARFQGVRVGRVAVWGSGHTGDLVGRNGYRWVSYATAGTEHAELLAQLQNRMRRAEGELAVLAASLGWNVVLDGPLNHLRSLHELVCGYVKTHHRQLLSDDEHQRIPLLEVGGRTRLYSLGADRFTCYTRVGAPSTGATPWSGIVRLEFPATAGLDAIAQRSTYLASVLPQFAGQTHRDPRAPMNLAVVHNLERHLGQVMGRVEFATRAARDAVLQQGALR